MRNKIEGGIIGLAVGDALGMPVEWRNREWLKRNPVTDMLGTNARGMSVGTWTDDTSLTLCLLDSLSKGLDYTDVMEKFLLWFSEGQYTASGIPGLGVGTSTEEAIRRFRKGDLALSCGGVAEKDNGNGSLMRILPLAFYLHTKYGSNFFEHADVIEIIHNMSRLTHAHTRSCIGCGIYVSIAGNFIDEMRPEVAVERGIQTAMDYYRRLYPDEVGHYQRLSDREFKNTPEEAVNSGGYVVDTLEAAIWCLLNTDNYESCVLKAVNLGGDTDTVAAVAGGLAGIYYGLDAIPAKWRKLLAKLSFIEDLCRKFYVNIQA